MKVEINELAAIEFDDAIDWYEMQSKGLGDRFKKHVLKQVNKIKKNPTWFLIEEEQIYKAFIPKFPYKILYTVEEKKIIIWAIAHLHRKPWYWQNRLNK
ncbi:MAG: type II toxin-antitoxin system RelE/ParE family toxin [bacterium]|nr:type II toxin-antitoxin system RelE/ParE family toxin [bacterium]